MDARTSTEPILFECQHILEADLCYKVICVTPDPSKGFMGIASDVASRIPMHVWFLTSSGRLPSRERPIRELITQESIDEHSATEAFGITKRILDILKLCLLFALPWIGGWWWQHWPGYVIPACLSPMILISLQGSDAPSGVTRRRRSDYALWQLRIAWTMMIANSIAVAVVAFR